MSLEPDKPHTMNALELPPELNVLTQTVIGAAMHVHSVLGVGLREKFYEQALASHLSRQGIRCAQQVPFKVFFEGELLGEQCIDLVIESQVIVECKGVASFSDHDHAQLLGYLRFTGLPLGLLMNFHAPRLKDGLSRKINWPVAPRSPDLCIRSSRINTSAAAKSH